MTQEELFDVLAKIFRYIVGGLAVIGLFTIAAALTYAKEKPVARTANCINSACDLPCTVKFKRHAGDCK